MKLLKYLSEFWQAEKDDYRSMYSLMYPSLASIKNRK